ncbi:MAG: YbaB/EbfC family nucleoid-associated protein [Epsilonproteobacteria bacterium]|nr:YbaB/EbfC family nucleoid-associated protein [Campylobacterota bacterium]
MFGDFDLNKMQEMLKDIEQKAKEMEEKSKNTILTATGGGGMVSVSANGTGEIVDVTIDDSLLDDKDSLQILLISTINDALKMVEDNKKNQALNMFGGLNPFGGKE